MENVVGAERHSTVFDETRNPERKGNLLFNFQGPKRQVGHNNAEGPPVPIPNTEVKLCSAENTYLATDREDRSKPTQCRKTAKRIVVFLFIYE